MKKTKERNLVSNGEATNRITMLEERVNSLFAEAEEALKKGNVSKHRKLYEEALQCQDDLHRLKRATQE